MANLTALVTARDKKLTYETIYMGAAYVSEQTHSSSQRGFSSILLSENYGYLLDGLDSADRVSWDAHKWLFQTYGCGIVIV